MIADWLMELEENADRAAYLWPRTPIGNIQAEIWRRCGASDWNLDHANCRARNIVDTLRQMDVNGLLGRGFTVLDLCCGDGVVLLQIGRVFLHAECYGVDLLRYPSHRLAELRGGCSFYRAPLQSVVDTNPPRIIDVAIMLNTFRGWDKADVPLTETQLPIKTLQWMKRFCRYVFLTITRPQYEWLKREGWFIWRIGRGEDDSDLICGFPCEGPEGQTGRWTLGTHRL